MPQKIYSPPRLLFSPSQHPLPKLNHGGRGVSRQISQDTNCVLSGGASHWGGGAVHTHTCTHARAHGCLIALARATGTPGPRRPAPLPVASSGLESLQGCSSTSHTHQLGLNSVLCPSLLIFRLIAPFRRNAYNAGP